MMTESANVSQAIALGAHPGIFREAIDMAIEFDSIRYIYGDDCCSYVQSRLTTSPSIDWRRIIDGAVASWVETTGRRSLDLNL